MLCAVFHSISKQYGEYVIKNQFVQIKVYFVFMAPFLEALLAFLAKVLAAQIIRSQADKYFRKHEPPFVPLRTRLP